MNRNIVIIGVVIVIAAIVLLFVVPSSITPPYTYLNSTLEGGRFSSIGFNITNSTYLFLLAENSSSTINMYIFNSSAFSAWSSMVVNSNYTNGLSAAESLKGLGTRAIFTNATYLIFPLQNGSTDGNRIYPAGNSTLNYAGQLVFVFQNQNGNTTGTGVVHSTISYIPPITKANIGQNKKIDNYLYATGGVSLGAIVAIVIGIILVIYGALKKPKDVSAQPGSIQGAKPAGTEKEMQERDTLYKGIGSDEKKPRKGSKKAKNADGSGS